MSTLAILAACVAPQPTAPTPPVPTHLRGLPELAALAGGGYPHLASPAGRASRPPSASVRGALGYLPGPPLRPRVPAGRRVADMADAAGGRLAQLAGAPLSGAVRRVLHCQATLDRQILASSCLRTAFAHFPKHEAALTLGQVGTSGVPTALQLAAMLGASDPELLAISAADAWIDPFDGDFTPLVNYGDAAGALLVSTEEPSVPPLALVEAVRTGWSPAAPLHALGPECAAEAMVAGVARLIGELRAARLLDGRPLDGVIGEAYGLRLAERVLERAGLAGGELAVARAHHFGNAEFINSLLCGVARAHAAGAARRFLLWSASPCGAAAVALVCCLPHPVHSGADGALMAAAPAADFTRGAHE